MQPFGILGFLAGGSVAPLANGWLTPPTMTDTAVNGKSDACGLFCNVLNIGNSNYFSCIATGDYTVSVYNSVGGALISSQNVASNVQCNWQIDWSACTHNVDADTRQAYVEITPQSGQSLTLVRFNTNHPAESNGNSAPNIVSAYGVLPALTNATNMFGTCYALQSVTLPSLPALTNAGSMFGTATESTCLRSIRKLSTDNLGSVFANATTFILRYTAMQEAEALSWVASLGSSANTITFDLRSNPFSTSTLVAPAILAKFPNATVTMV